MKPRSQAADMLEREKSCGRRVREGCGLWVVIIVLACRVEMKKVTDGCPQQCRSKARAIAT